MKIKWHCEKETVLKWLSLTAHRNNSKVKKKCRKITKNNFNWARTGNKNDLILKENRRKIYNDFHSPLKFLSKVLLIWILYNLDINYYKVKCSCIPTNNSNNNNTQQNTSFQRSAKEKNITFREDYFFSMSGCRELCIEHNSVFFHFNCVNALLNGFQVIV